MFRLVSLVFLFPSLATAAAPTDFKGLLGIFNEIIGVLVGFVFTFTVFVIIWGIMQAWILNPGDERAVEKGKRIALIGIIALAIMLSIWGILSILRYSLFGIY
jgi:hypothetical protein